MKITKNSLLLFAILFSLLQGCAAINPGKWFSVDFKPQKRVGGGKINSYIINKPDSAFIGQPILKVELCDGKQKAAISTVDLNVNTKYNRNLVSIKVDAFTSRDISGKVSFEGNQQLVLDLPPNYYGWDLLVSDDGTVNRSALYSDYYKMVYVPEKIDISPLKFEFIDRCIRTTSHAISYDLIYAGKNDVSLNVTYREFTANDMARPAFFQNLTYEANAKQIRFKDYLIKIIDVSNEKITYTIIEDGER